MVATVGNAIYHEQRFANGTRTPLNFQTNTPAAILSSGSSADDNGNLQVVLAVGANIYHEIRFPDGSWTTLNFQTTALNTIWSISGTIG